MPGLHGCSLTLTWAACWQGYFLYRNLVKLIILALGSALYIINFHYLYFILLSLTTGDYQISTVQGDCRPVHETINPYPVRNSRRLRLLEIL